MSKETKLAKKEAKAAKKAAKTEKKQAAAYSKLVKKIEKKNAKLEKKANKKNKPFVPIAIPTQEEAFAAAGGESKGKKIFEMIVLILLIVYLIYFCYMFANYVAPSRATAQTEVTTSASEEEGSGEAAEYEKYKNPHDITTTPTYSVGDAKAFLKQTLHDNWKSLGYSSDPSTGSINYTNSTTNVNNADCYVFTAGSKTFAVSTKLQSCYVSKDGKYSPVTFHNDEYLF